jgi:type IV pilus assembly protein PilX
MTLRPSLSRLPRSLRRQQGAVLFVGLMLLLLMALLGVAGMQATTLQERMAGNYRNYNLAFQHAEATVRQREKEVDNIVDSNGTVQSDTNCSQEDNFDRIDWVATQTTPGTSVSDIGRCALGYGGGSIGENPANQSLSLKLRVLGFDHDQPTDHNATAIVETIFIP